MSELVFACTLELVVHIPRFRGEKKYSGQNSLHKNQWKKLEKNLVLGDILLLWKWFLGGHATPFREFEDELSAREFMVTHPYLEGTLTDTMPFSPILTAYK